MWERFSYYGIRPLLVLFMTAALLDGGFGFDARGGVGDRRHLRGVRLSRVAPRRLDRRSMARSHGGRSGTAACSSRSATSRSRCRPSSPRPTFFLGLILIVIGTGLLKPNISAIVGDLYPEGGARRDAGFSIFYMGINIGAFARAADHRLPGRAGRLALGLRRRRRRHGDRPASRTGFAPATRWGRSASSRRGRRHEQRDR